MEVSAEETGHCAAIAFGAPGEAADFQSGKPSFWVGEGAEASAPLHVAFVARSRAAVDVFYHAAIKAGGADNGAPGLRPQYHTTYCAAFVLDPDGNNIEAVCDGPEREPSRSPDQRGAPRYLRAGLAITMSAVGTKRTAPNKRSPF